MAAKPLPSQEVLRQLLDYNPETGKLFWKERGAEWFSTNRSHSTWNARFAGNPALSAIDSGGYLSGSILYGMCRAHRVIWKMETGEEAVGVDHINGDRSDNRWSNLRNVDHPENMKNMRMNAKNTSGVMGVSFNRQRRTWQAFVTVESSRINLGNFQELEDAIAARLAAEKRYGFHRNHGRAA